MLARSNRFWIWVRMKLTKAHSALLANGLLEQRVSCTALFIHASYFRSLSCADFRLLATVFE
jgi:hypothetical protein